MEIIPKPEMFVHGLVQLSFENRQGWRIQSVRNLSHYLMKLTFFPCLSPLAAACPIALHPGDELASAFAVISHQNLEGCIAIPPPPLHLLTNYLMTSFP